MVQWLRLCTPNAGGPGLIPGQGTRSHMLQRRVCMPQRKIPRLQLRPGTAKWKSTTNKQTNKKPNNWDAAENALILEGHRLKMTLEKWGVEQTQAQPRDWVYHKNHQVIHQQVKPREIHRKPMNLTSSWDQKLGTKPQPAVPSQATLAERLQRQQMREVSCRWRSSEGSEWALTFYLEGQTCPHNPRTLSWAASSSIGAQLQMQDLLCDRKR